jgi:tRNA dimethylallyltransferase
VTDKGEAGPPVVLVTGSTASGKTALSFALAKLLPAEIVNIDSVQLYRHADIGSAKPSLAERASAPTHLFDSFDPNEVVNAAEFARSVSDTAVDIQKRGKIPLLVGSSGLYIAALFYGLPELPARNAELRTELDSYSNDQLYRMLLERESRIAAALHPNDKMRVMRALEISLAGGTERRGQERVALLHGLIISLTMPRAALYDRINKRAEQMVQDGLLTETEKIVKNFGAASPVLRSLGYAQSLQVLNAELAQKDLADSIALYTRQYAKRQMTFWNNEPKKRGWRERPNLDDQSVISMAECRPERLFQYSDQELAARINDYIIEEQSGNEVWHLFSCKDLV